MYVKGGAVKAGAFRRRRGTGSGRLHNNLKGSCLSERNVVGLDVQVRVPGRLGAGGRGGFAPLRRRLQGFALRQGVHPGIVSGQLQHLKEVGWDAHRDLLVKVRALLIPAALTDGWGLAPLALKTKD